MVRPRGRDGGAGHGHDLAHGGGVGRGGRGGGGAGGAGAVQGHRHHVRGAAGPEVRADHGPAQRAAGRGLPDEDRLHRARGHAWSRRARWWPSSTGPSSPPRWPRCTLALTRRRRSTSRRMLDSTLNLSKAREDIRTMELGLEEKQLAKEQAVYEAPTVKRQAEIDLREGGTGAGPGQARTTRPRPSRPQAKMREVGADRRPAAEQARASSRK